MRQIHDYKTWIFDCDGVILDSNTIKTDAFYEIGLLYGKNQADEFVAYHKKFGGISRFDKFKHFFEKILHMKDYTKQLALALESYSSLVKEKLLQCPETQNLRLFLNEIPKETRRIIVSGGLQSEVREVLIKRGLADYFDAIYGSPASKMEILQKELDKNRIIFPAVFIGDTQYDYEISHFFNMDFIFMSSHSEFLDWNNYFKDKKVCIISNLSDITFNVLRQ